MSRHPSTPHAAPRSTALAAHLLCASLALCAIAAQAQPTAAPTAPSAAASPERYAIPAGPLAAALNRLGRESGALITFAPELTNGVHTQGLHGHYTVPQALAILLASTDLAAQSDTSGSYALRRISFVQPTAGTGVSLAEVRVTAPASTPEQLATTEGTGAYSTRATAAAIGMMLSPRETPQSISVLTRQQLDDENPTTLGEALKSVTGIMAFSSDSERTDLYARGFYISNYQYDGVPTTVANDFFGASTADPFLYDRIEVVRGATGMLTGAGEPSASVNLVRKRASSKEFAGSASLGWGTWGHHRGTVDISTPLTADGRVRARAGVMLEERHSHLARYSNHKQAAFATLEADLGPRTTLRAGVEHQTNRPTDVTWGGLPLMFTDGTPTHWDRSTSTSANWTYWNSSSDVYFAGLEHQFDNQWNLKLDAQRRSSDFDAKLLYLFGLPDRITGTGVRALPNYSQHTLTQNNVSAQATGPFTLAGRLHEAVVGFTSSQSHRLSNSYGRANTPSTGNFYAWDGSYAEPQWTTRSRVGDDRLRQTAMYGAVRFSLTDPLKLIVGGRHNTWKSTSLTEERKHEVTTPYAGLIYTLSPELSLYTSYTDIFNPQSYRDAQGRYLDPVIGKSYEAGIKGEHFNGALTTSLSVFRIQQDNVAVLDGVQIVPGTTDSAYVGAKGVSSRGIEAQVSGELARGWNASAGVAYTQAKDAEGTRLNTASPRTRLQLFTTYRLPGDWSALTLGGGMTWVSNTSSTINTALAGEVVYRQNSYAVTSLMARYAVSPALSLQLNVHNLFDKRYYANMDGQGHYGTPRSAMLTMNYKF